jgi:methyl-accepting chemotaxis protein
VLGYNGLVFVVIYKIIVSNEVRKLAEQTKKSIAEIDAIVQSSNECMKDVVDSVLGVFRQVRRNLD